MCRSSEIEPYRRAGADAYELIDEVPPRRRRGSRPGTRSCSRSTATISSLPDRTRATSWPTSSCSRARPTSSANVWLNEVRKAQASPTYRFVFNLPYHLPHWGDRYRTDEQLRGMRDDARDGPDPRRLGRRAIRRRRQPPRAAPCPARPDRLGGPVRRAALDAEADLGASAHTRQPARCCARPRLRARPADSRCRS